MPKVSTVAEFAGQIVSRDVAALGAALFAPINRQIAEAIKSVTLPTAPPADPIGPHHRIEGTPCRN